MKIIFLGTGDAFCSGGRANTSILIDSTYKILLDCSPQAIYNLRRLEYKVSDVDYIFLSHLHGDHAGGLPFVVLTLKFKEPGKIIVSGPSSVSSFVERVYGAYYGIGSIYDVLDFRDLKDSYPFELSFIDAKHPVEAYIYRIKIEGKTIVYSGDTSVVDLKDFAYGADLLIHEASETNEERARLFGHSTPFQAARIAAESHVKQLALVHRPLFDTNTSSKVREVFADTFFPNDLDNIRL
ncbi:MAG: MBL fold metallo-hydrolase [Thaumarchaeota archaeon]|nr:MBL fold metallo-hydrolase [Nitrososphaerota archaeon]